MCEERGPVVKKYRVQTATIVYDSDNKLDAFFEVDWERLHVFSIDFVPDRSTIVQLIPSGQEQGIDVPADGLTFYNDPAYARMDSYDILFNGSGMKLSVVQHYLQIVTE